MTIEQLKSGSYRITQMHQGKRYRVTVDHKPTAKEATILIAEEMRHFHGTTKSSSSFEAAYRQYADSRSNVCSPSTLLNYDGVIRNMPEWFRSMNVYEIEQIHVQKLVNDYAEDHSPKSVRNLHGLVSSVLKMARPEIILRTKLPDKKRQDVYIPTDEEVQAILREVKGTRFEAAFYLAVFGLRRGEICALTLDDLEGNMISVTKSKVLRPDQTWTIKETPKTEESNRRVFIPDYLRDLILEQGYIYKGHPGDLFKALARTEEKLGIEHFALHKLRHYFASMTHDMGISDADIMAMGGWKTDNVMKTVYRHSVESSVSQGQRLYADKIGKMLTA